VRPAPAGDELEAWELGAIDLDAEERDAVGERGGDDVGVLERREAEGGAEIGLVDGDVRDRAAPEPGTEVGGLGVVEDRLEGWGGARPLVEEGGDVVVGALGDLVGGPVVLGVALGVAGGDVGGEAGEVADQVADVPGGRGGDRGVGVRGADDLGDAAAD
jgi:hypothetical protein